MRGEAFYSPTFWIFEVYKLEDKALAQKVVKIITNQFPRIDETILHDIESINRDKTLHSEEHNNTVLTACD